MGKKSSKTTSKTTPWEPAQGDILGSIGTVRDVVGGNQGNLDSIAGDIRGFLPQLGQQAFGSNPMVQAGQGYATDVLGGKYLNANPYMDGMVNQTANDVQDRVNSLFGKSGAQLGTQHAGVLTRELANAENSMRYGNYAQERQNQQGAAGMVPSLYGSQFAGVTPYLAAAQTAGQLPYAGIGALSPIIGLAGGSGQSTGRQPGGWGGDLLNAAASIGSAAIMASDVRLKHKVSFVSNLEDGLAVYDYEYRRDIDPELPEGTFRGVLAQDVAKLRPWALGPVRADGHLTVNYGAL